MTKNERLKDVIEGIKYRYKIKQKDIVEQIGLRSTTYLSDLISGKSELTDSVSDKLWRVFHINKAYLSNGDGEIWEDDFQKDNGRNFPDIVSMPADVWAVISSQAESLKSKDRQIDIALAQTSEMLELLKEQLKKGLNATTRLRAANLVVEEDE